MCVVVDGLIVDNHGFALRVHCDESEGDFRVHRGDFVDLRLVGGASRNGGSRDFGSLASNLYVKFDFLSLRLTFSSEIILGT